jgi:cytochrome c2
MATFLKVTAWVFLLCASLVGVGYWIPAETTGPAPAQQGPIGEKPEELIKAGEAVFFGADSCHVCHALDPDVPNKRCPVNMKEVFSRASSRAEEIKKERDPTMTPIKYLVESVYDPNVYVVKDKAIGGPFSKNVMKAINGPPLALSDQQIKAALAFLISQNGTEVDSEVVKAIDAAQAPWKGKKAILVAGAEEFKIPEGDPEDGKETFGEMKCWQCHKIAGEVFGTVKEGEGGVGPDLAGVGGIQTAQYLMESILNPSAVVVSGEGFAGSDGESIMPEYHDTMTLRQLVDVVAWLKTLKGGEAQ